MGNRELERLSFESQRRKREIADLVEQTRNAIEEARRVAAQARQAVVQNRAVARSSRYRLAHMQPPR